MYFYNARWYDSALGRFAQADTIVPGGVQGLDRYAYVNNNAVRYTDPSGHRCVGGSGGDDPRVGAYSAPPKAKGTYYPLDVDLREHYQGGIPENPNGNGTNNDISFRNWILRWIFMN